MKKLFSTLLASLLLMGSLCPQYAVAMDYAETERALNTINEHALRASEQLKSLDAVLALAQNKIQQPEDIEINNVSALRYVIEQLQQFRGYLQHAIAESDHIPAQHLLNVYANFTRELLELAHHAIHDPFAQDIATEIEGITQAINTNQSPFDVNVPALLEENLLRLEDLNNAYRQIHLTLFNRAYRGSARFLTRYVAPVAYYGIPLALVAGSMYWNIRRAQAANAQLAQQNQAAKASTDNPNMATKKISVGDFKVTLGVENTNPQPQALVQPQPTARQPGFFKTAFNAIADFTASAVASNYAKAVLTPIIVYFLGSAMHSQQAISRAVITFPRAMHNRLAGETPPEPLSTFSTVEQPKITFANIIEAEDITSFTDPLIDFMVNPQTQMMIRDGRLNPIKSALIAGPPGSGKTHFAKALCGEITQRLRQQHGAEHKGIMYLECNHAQILNLNAQAMHQQSRSDQDESKRIKSGLQTLIEKAQAHAPCLLLIDEIDKLPFEKHETLLGDFLQILDGLNDIAQQEKPIIILATANNPEKLYPALKREGRLGKCIWLDYPNAAQRTQYLTQKLTGQDNDTVAHITQRTQGCSFVDLDTIIERANLLASKSNTLTTSIDHFDTSINAHVHRIATDTPTNPRICEHIAAHQAGRVVAHHVFTQGEPQYCIDLATICAPMPTSSEHATKKYGQTILQPIDESGTCDDRKTIVRNITTAVAGEIAEQILLGDHNRSYHSSQEEIDTYCQQADVDEDALEKIKTRVQATLIREQALLERVQQKLFERHTLTGRQLERIIAECTQVRDE